MEPPEFRQFDIIKALQEEQCPNDSRRATWTLEAALEAKIELFCNAAGEPLVRVHGERQGQVWPLRSPRVRDWLAMLCRQVTLAGDGDDENRRPSPGPSPLKPKPDRELPKGDAGDGQKRAGQKRIASDGGLIRRLRRFRRYEEEATRAESITATVDWSSLHRFFLVSSSAKSA